ncbi:MAG: hypothetical protein NC829_00515 [Candidatus Omnitrophica bacterium]|nr:hypothetical protein [Candidatus Omnitrophota bacterium]
MAPGGICIFTTPNLGWWLNRIILIFGFQPYLTEVSLKHNVGKFKADNNLVYGHIRNFTNRSLRELLKINNFIIIRMHTTDVSNVFPFPINLFEKCLSFIPTLSHSNIFITQAKKVDNT